jgi:bacteriocin-like protein
MAKVKITEIPKDRKLTDDELKAIVGGVDVTQPVAIQVVQPTKLVSPSVSGVGILMCAKPGGTTRM